MQTLKPPTKLVISACPIKISSLNVKREGSQSSLFEFADEVSQRTNISKRYFGMLIHLEKWKVPKWTADDNSGPELVYWLNREWSGDLDIYDPGQNYPILLFLKSCTIGGETIKLLREKLLKGAILSCMFKVLSGQIQRGIKNNEAPEKINDTRLILRSITKNLSAHNGKRESEYYDEWDVVLEDGKISLDRYDFFRIPCLFP
jgi:hypothetical protein